MVHCYVPSTNQAETSATGRAVVVQWWKAMHQPRSQAEHRRKRIHGVISGLLLLRYEQQPGFRETAFGGRIGVVPRMLVKRDGDSLG